MSKLSQSEIDALFSKYTEPGAALPPDTEEPAPAAPAPGPMAEAPVVFPVLEPAPAAPGGDMAPLSLLAEVEVDVTVRLGRTRRSIREILSLGAGAVLELDNLAGEAVDILVNGRLVARGEVVVVGDNYGVRVTELVRVDGERLI